MTKLLVVDDDRGILDMIRGFFEPRGYTVFCSETARDGLQIVFKERPDIVLLDYTLGDYNGDEVLIRIKKNLPGIKVIVISGITDPSFAEKIKSCGADAFFAKGTSIISIENQIKEFLLKIS